MSKIEVGDTVRVICRNGSDLEQGSVHPIFGIDEWGIFLIEDTVRDTVWHFTDDCLELVEKKMKKYKLETELTLQDVLQLRFFTGRLCNMTPLHMEVDRICEGELGHGYDNNKPRFDWDDRIPFQGACRDIIEKAKRKTVVVGDKTYYEDELQTALANIKPL